LNVNDYVRQPLQPPQLPPLGGFHNPYVLLSCLLSAVCCLLSAVCCLLSAVCCLLSAVCCLLSAVCCLQRSQMTPLVSFTVRSLMSLTQHGDSVTSRVRATQHHTTTGTRDPVLCTVTPTLMAGHKAGQAADSSNSSPPALPTELGRAPPSPQCRVVPRRMRCPKWSRSLYPTSLRYQSNTNC
jgi:hypothetical protein